ncbi:MAG: hypothetical protein NVSMB48_00520 [Marmoricola sp.]
MPSSGGEGQLALFGVGRVPNLWTRDFRSVGELLADTDFQSRALLMDLVVDDAPGLLIGWPDLLEASADLWRAFPTALTPVAAQSEQRVMDLLVMRGNGYRAALDKARAYLAGVEPDPRLATITDTLTRTTRLVSKFGGDVDVSKEPARGDLAAARTRLLHTLYLTVHSVHSSMRQLRAEALVRRAAPAELLPKLGGYRFTSVIWILDKWVQRLGSTEATVGRALDGAYPRALKGEVSLPPDQTLRLPRALATWEVAVNRVLCASPTNADLALISRTEGLITAAGHRVIGAAPAAAPNGVLELCEPVAAGWARTSSWWHTLTPVSELVSDALVGAASDLRAAIRDVTFDRTHPAVPETIAAHPEFTDAVEALLITLEHVHETAAAFSDISYGSKMRGPARALSRVSHDLGEIEEMEADTIWVSPTDTLTNPMIPAPKPVARAIRMTAQNLESDAAALAQAAIQACALVRPSIAITVAGATLGNSSHRRHRPAAYARETTGPTR